MATFIGKIDVFDESAESWDCYSERLDEYFTANEIDNDKQVPALLSLVGGRTYQILRDLTSPNKPGTKTYKALCELLQKHFNPRPLVIAERFRFYKRDQRPDESVKDFNISLRKLAEHCEFKEQLNEQLRDKFVCGLHNEAIQRKLLSEKDLTYEKAYDTATAMEAATKDVKELQGNKFPTQSVNKLSFKKNYDSKKQETGPKPKFRPKGQESKPPKPKGKCKPCYRCNRTNHLADNCRFKNAKCHKCGKTGHISPACKPNFHNLDVEEEEEYEEYMYSIRDDNDRKFIKVTPEVNGKSVLMELDTGSGVSVMSKADATQYWGEHVMDELNETPLKLKTYSGEVIKPLGYITCSVRLGDQSETLNLYILEQGGRPLLGREWLRRLKLNWTEIKAMMVNSGGISEKQRLKNKFPEVFSSELGQVKGMKAHLKLKENAQPKFVKARTVPFAMKPLIEKELDSLVEKGVLTPVTHSEWATPIVAVPKANGGIRICGDFKVTLNPLIEVDQYPLPKIEDIFADIGGGQKFSKIDLKDAYLQIEVDEESSQMLTISTHKGLFRYNRLVFGVSSAPAIFQRTIENIVNGIPGIRVILDDMIITGANTEEHIRSLEQVLQRLQEHGLRVNNEKCSFFQDKLSFCGHDIDEKGLHKMDAKIEAIVNAPEISNVRQLRSFLGLVQYYAKFLPNLSTVLHPLHALLRKNARWSWTADCQAAVKKVKEMIVSDKVLVHYNPDYPITLACDASSYGLGCVLSHVMPNGEEKPIAFASRSLNSAEKQYSQIDKEALSIVWGVKKFHVYLFGRHFTLITDHKPLLSILSPSKGVSVATAARLQRYALFLAGHQYSIKYKRTDLHGNCDSLSRLPLETCQSERMDSTDIFHSEVIQKLPISKFDIARLTRTDKTLSSVFECLKSGWPESCSRDSDLYPYFNRRNELSLFQGCIMWGQRVVVPKAHQKAVLNELHEGHLGLVKMKSLSRGYVWWPGLDQDLEALTKSCVGCIQSKRLPPEAPIHPWEYPKRPWSRVHVDFAGPFQGHMFLVMVDAYSKWPVVKVMGKTTTTQTIEVFRSVFADYGICEIVVSDNGPQFVSEEMKDFFRLNGVKHITSAPYHPRSNGLAERFVQTFKQALKAAKRDSGTIQTKLSKFLLQYRNTAHSTTKECPSVLFMGRSLSTRLDRLKPKLVQTVEEQQAKMVRATRDRSFEIGQSVSIRDYRARGEKWISGSICEKTGPVSYRVEIEPGVSWRRHTDQIQQSEANHEQVSVEPIPAIINAPLPKEIAPTAESDRDTSEGNVAPSPSRHVHSPEPGRERRYPQRERKKVVKLDL